MKRTSILGLVEVATGYIITALIVLVALSTLAIVLSLKYGMNMNYLMQISGCCPRTAVVTPSLIALSTLVSSPSVPLLRNASSTKRRIYILAGAIIVVIVIAIACGVFCRLCGTAWCNWNIKNCTIPNIIVDGVSGLLVKPENPEELAKALTRVLVDGELRNKIAKNVVKLRS